VTAATAAAAVTAVATSQATMLTTINVTTNNLTTTTPYFCESQFQKYLNYTFRKQHCGGSDGQSIQSSLVFAAVITITFIFCACTCYFGQKDFERRHTDTN